MNSITRSVFVFVVAAAQSNVWGQAASSGTASPIKIGNVTFSGSIRSRVYFWDWFEPAAGNNSYQYSGNLFRIGLSQSRDSWDWNAEFAVPFLLGLPANATGTGPQQARSALEPTTSLRIPATA